MTSVELYDATLRDGMQGQGMTLSAHEKLRVAHRLDELGVHLIEAGFPSSNPKELELFELLAGSRLTASISVMPVGNANPIRKPAGISTARATKIRTASELDVVAAKIIGNTACAVKR